MDNIRLFWWIPVLAVLILVILADRFLLPLLTKGAGKFLKGRRLRCRQCKGMMMNITSSLYVLPVHFDHIHERSAAYYRKNAKAIAGIEQVPSGNRACKMTVSQCSVCGYKEVEVIDFLPVRGQEVIEGADVYPYSEFGQFFNNLKYADAEKISSVNKQGKGVERVNHQL